MACPNCGFTGDPTTGRVYDVTYPCPNCGQGGAVWTGDDPEDELLSSEPGVDELKAIQVVARYQRQAAFIPDKFFKKEKEELKRILQQPPKEESPRYWAWCVRDGLRPFFTTFKDDFEGLTKFVKELGPATKIVQDKVDSALRYLDAVIDKLDTMGSFGDGLNLNDPEEYLTWYASTEIHERMSEEVKTLGDIIKWQWIVNPTMVDALVKKTLKAASPEVKEALVKSDFGSGRGIDIKWEFLFRVKFKESARKAVKRVKLDWSPIKWVDKIYELLQAEYSDQTVAREFDLQGMKVIVDDSTVSREDIEKYAQYLIEAHSKLKSKGFGKAWYGNVFIQCENCGGVNRNTGGGVGGWFDIRPNTVSIFSRPGPFIIELIVHELGHRYWFKNLSSTQREKFRDLVKTHTAPRPLDTPKVVMFDNQDAQHLKQKVDRICTKLEQEYGMLKQLDPSGMSDRYWQGIRNSWVDVCETLKKDLTAVLHQNLTLDQDVADSVHSSWITVWSSMLNLDHSAADMDLEGWSRFLGLARWAVPQIRSEAFKYIDLVVEKQNEKSRKILESKPESKEWLESYERNPNPVLPVSGYGKSNIDEAFAEVFASYVLENEMDRDQLESFRSVVSSTEEDDAEDLELMAECGCPLNYKVASRYLVARGYFEQGDYVLFGKYKNKPGKLVRMFTDDRGVPMVEIEPIPKGRKKPKTMGLFKFWHLPKERLEEIKAKEVEEKT
jgi:hypothetical protein